MPLQTGQLSILGLSIRGDVPPNNIQPQLRDGIYLRWAFERDAGFPWYGFYLFRRNHDSGDLIKTKLDIPGVSGTAVVYTPQGPLTSDEPITLTSDFPPVARAIDLTNRTYVRFTPWAPGTHGSLPVSEFDLSIGFRSAGSVVITAFLGRVPVARVRVSGVASQIVQAVLIWDAMTSIEISSADAALVALSFISVTNGAALRWQALPNYSYPLPLPVAHPNYPCPGKPPDIASAQAMALGRIKYGLPNVWSGANFLALHNQLATLVAGGSNGPAMASIQSRVAGTGGATMMQSPLDLVLLAGLNAAVAQMVGLYWVDDTAAPGTHYDYLLLADPDGRLGGSATSALQYLSTNGLNSFNSLDGYIVYDLSIDTPATPLNSPSNPRVYALPDMCLPSGATPTGNSAGLKWDLGLTATNDLRPGQPVLYHLWRADLGNGAQPTPGGTFALVTQSGPLLVADALSGASSQPTPPSDWPPFKLHFIDSGLADGWYGYQVSGIDIFGRHSANSGSAPWYEWATPSPLPWYYVPPPGDTIVNASAVAFRDYTPPPSPTSVEAYALDPADPTLLQDAAYNNWRQGLAPGEQNLLGLRVKWLWTQAQMDQAPNTREFRIYYQPGRLNSVPGNITTVATASATESTINTDIANTYATDEYVGATLQVGGDGFAIVGSAATSPLQLTVNNIGPNKDVQPATHKPCTISIPGGVPPYGAGGGAAPHALFIDYSMPTNWNQRYYVVPYGDHVTEELDVLSSATGASLTGVAATAIGAVVYLDGTPDLSGDDVFDAYLQLSSDQARADHLYRVIAPGPTIWSVTVDAAPALADPSAWEIVRRLRRYDVILPAPGDVYRGGLPLTPSYAEPVAYAQIGVTAADDKTYVADDPKWAAGRWGGAARFGNEGKIGPTATVFCVLRTQPPAPVSPPLDSEKVYASEADYRSHSFYTYRWAPTEGLKTHIFRALDDAVFSTDWNLPARPALDPVNNPNDRALFPTEPSWDNNKLQAVATELNGLNANKGGPYTEAAMAQYDGLSNDALRVLAGLPGNDAAFTQLTIQPLDPDDPTNADRRGPNDPDNYAPQTTVRAYLDTLDGRTTSRYFYRALYVDGAHNRSGLSLATPPVYCPDVVPPRAPTVTSAMGGDRAATLQWTVNREADLDRYLIFRSETPDRLSNPTGLTPTEVLPQAGAETQQLVDQPLIGNRTYYYNVAARDTSGNVSAPSRVFAVYVADTQLANQPPGLTAVRAQQTLINGVTQLGVRVSWLAPPEPLEYQIQRRRAGEALWQTLNAGWLRAGTLQYFDSEAAPDTRFQYRLRVRKASGNVNVSYVVVEVLK
jgi:hypothetical protein